MISARCNGVIARIEVIENEVPLAVSRRHGIRGSGQRYGGRRQPAADANRGGGTTGHNFRHAAIDVASNLEERFCSCKILIRLTGSQVRVSAVGRRE